MWLVLSALQPTASACTMDAYEPNNTRATASELGSTDTWNTTGHVRSLEVTGLGVGSGGPFAVDPRDWYTFTTTADGPATVTVSTDQPVHVTLIKGATVVDADFAPPGRSALLDLKAGTWDLRVVPLADCANYSLLIYECGEVPGLLFDLQTFKTDPSCP